MKTIPVWWCWLMIAVGVLFIGLANHSRLMNFFFAFEAKWTALRKDTFKAWTLTSGIGLVVLGIYFLITR